MTLMQDLRALALYGVGERGILMECIWLPFSNIIPASWPEIPENTLIDSPMKGYHLTKSKLSSSISQV